MRLDEEKLEELRRWGEALRETGDEGSVAAGRAILMLIEELERSRLELSRTRGQLDRRDPVSNDDVDSRETVASALDARLHQVLDQDSDQSPAAQPESTEDTGPESHDKAASARSWIEMLRRQQ